MRALCPCGNTDGLVCTRPIGHLDLRNVAAVAVYARINMNVFGADPLSLGGCSNDSISPWPLKPEQLGGQPAQGVSTLWRAEVYGVCTGYFSQFFFGRCDEMT